jgi:hypothetical protein
MKPLVISHLSGRIWFHTRPAPFISTLALFFALGLPSTADSATNTVMSLADSGPGSLRQVIANSAPEDTIIFSVAGVITLSGGELVLDRDLTVIGPGDSALAIDANYRSRVIRVATNITASVSGLTLRKGLGSGAPGGGIYNAGTLSVRSCVICSNITSIDTNGSGLPGGGVYSLGTLVLDSSSVSFNSTGAGLNGGSTYDIGYSGRAGGDGGGVWNSGGFSASSCRFSDNVTGGGGNGGFGRVFGGFGGGGGQGGGIYNGGTMTLAGCTISNNLTGSGVWRDRAG